MAESKKKVRTGKASVKREAPRSLIIARAGVKTGGQFAAMMSALMSDVIEGCISPGMANAAVNAGGKMLKAVELQIKFGTTQTDGRRVLELVTRDTPIIEHVTEAK